MTMSLEPYHIFMILATLTGALWAMGKLLLQQSFSNLDSKLDSKLDALKETKDLAHQVADHTHRLERDFLKMKSDMAVHYVRREDYIRLETSLSTRLDNISDKIDKLREK